MGLDYNLFSKQGGSSRGLMVQWVEVNKSPEVWTEAQQTLDTQRAIETILGRGGCEGLG